MDFLEQFAFPDLRNTQFKVGIVVSVNLADSEEVYGEFASSYAQAYGLRVSPATITELTAALGASLGRSVDVEFGLVALDGAACRLIITTDPGRFGPYAPAEGGEPELLVLLRGKRFAHPALLDRRDTRNVHNALAEAFDIVHAA